MRQTIILLLIICTLPLLVVAQQTDYGDMRGLFVSPRFASMGNGAQAVSDEPIPLANPAGIRRADRTSVYLGYSGYYQNSFSVTSAYTNYAIDSVQNIALSISYLYIPDIDSVELNQDLPGADSTYEFHSFTSSEIAFDVRYARTLLERDKIELMAGGSVHAKRRRLADWTSFGIGVDLGIISQFKRGMALSWQVQNVATEYTHWSDAYHENTLPVSYLGVGYIKDVTPDLALSLSYRSPDLFANSGMVNSSTGSESLFEDDTTQINPWQHPSQFFTEAALGAEIGIHHVAYIRMGWADTRKYSFGGGVQLFDHLEVDFVYAQSILLEGTYGVSLRYLF